jgi:hypothetical protein
MGVEYKHWLLASDLAWVGDQSVAGRVHTVLQEWGLIAEPPVIYSLDEGRQKKLRGLPGQLDNPPRDLLVEYPMIEGKAIAEIMGPSYYPDDSIGERYFQKIALIIGSDFRVYDGGEATGTLIVKPPTQAGKHVSPYKDYLPHSLDVYPATSDTEPPVTTFEVNSEGWPVPKGFKGIFRSGLALDCGKDLPAICEKQNTIPCRQFATAIQEAFGTDLVQIGLWY